MNEALYSIRWMIEACWEAVEGGTTKTRGSNPVGLFRPLVGLWLIVVASLLAPDAWAGGGTKITLTYSPTSVQVGQPVVFTATVSGGRTAPTGTVTFTDTTTAAAIGTATLNASGVATVSYAFTQVGSSDTIQASYSGDSSHSAVSTTTSVYVTWAQPTVTLTYNPAPVGVGNGYKLIATLTGAYKPTGRMDFYYGSTVLCNSCAVYNNGVVEFSYGTLPVLTSPGTVSGFTAIYSGDSNNYGATSAAISVTYVPNTTYTAVSVSPNPANIGQAATLTAIVSNPWSPTGTVTFYDGATVLGTSTLSWLGYSTYYPTYQASVNYVFTTGGSHNITATYSGDTNNNGSTSPAAALTVKPPTTTTLTSSLNPSVAGQTTTLTATVSGNTPTGTVAFMDGTTTLGTGTLNASGVTSFSAILASAGTHNITANYAGDANNSASTSTAITQTVNKATSATTLSATPNPAGVGQATTLTAAVTGASVSGSVTFMDGTNTLGSGTLNSSGIATLSYAFTSTGMHNISANYPGDTNNNASNSAVVPLTVGVPTTTQLSASPSVAAFNQIVNLTATISGTNLTGTVSFSDGSNTILSGVPVSNGIASISTSFTSKGTHGLTATYSGDASNAASISPATSVSVYAETISYFHNDVAGTPLAATDASGNLLWSESYRAYGDPVQTPLDANNNLWFTGKPYDSNTGLTYLGARYYDPVLGRFTGIDPKGFDERNLQSFNRFAYANNNPNKFVDPDGRNPILAKLIEWAVRYTPTATSVLSDLGGVNGTVGTGAVANAEGKALPALSAEARALTAADLGIEGTLTQLKGTIAMDGTRLGITIDMIEGGVSNQFSVLSKLVDNATRQGATEVRIEATLANEQLAKVLQNRWGWTITPGSGKYQDVITIPIHENQIPK